MGSTKKHKEKDREDKKSYKSRDVESSHSHSGRKVRKHKSRSRSLSPAGELSSPMKERERGHKRKHKEKRRHAGDESEGRLNACYIDIFMCYAVLNSLIFNIAFSSCILKIIGIHCST